MNVRFPVTAAEACGALAEDPTIVPLAGGTDLLVHWPDRHDARDATYLDLGRVPELRAHHWADEALVIGAMTTYWDLIRDHRGSDPST